MKIFSIRSRDDSLAYYVAALNEQQAVRLVEGLMGPMNPAHRKVQELVVPPKGYKPSEQPGILEEDTEYDE